MWGDENTMGVKFTKPKSQLHNVAPEIYWRAIAWVKKAMVTNGYLIDSVVFSPDQSMWFFYEDGFLCMRLSHDTMDAIYTRLTDSVTQVVQTFTPEEIERWR